MKPNFRYFKCKLDVEPIKSLDEQWRKDREIRDEKLDAIFNTIPFYECWRGSERNIFGIVCSLDSPEYAKIKEDKTYKFEMVENEKVVITGNGRTKAGKEFNAKIQSVSDILNQYPSFNDFMLRKLKLLAGCLAHALVMCLYVVLQVTTLSFQYQKSQRILVVINSLQSQNT